VNSPGLEIVIDYLRVGGGGIRVSSRKNSAANQHNFREPFKHYARKKPGDKNGDNNRKILLGPMCRRTHYRRQRSRRDCGRIYHRFLIPAAFSFD
jgi:hypothetical protein